MSEEGEELKQVDVKELNAHFVSLSSLFQLLLIGIVVLEIFPLLEIIFYLRYISIDLNKLSFLLVNQFSRNTPIFLS